MNQIAKILDGKKTYIGLIAGGLLGLFQSMGWVDPKVAEALWVPIGLLTGVSIRLAIKKSEKQG